MSNETFGDEKKTPQKLGLSRELRQFVAAGTSQKHLVSLSGGEDRSDIRLLVPHSKKQAKKLSIASIRKKVSRIAGRWPVEESNLAAWFGLPQIEAANLLDEMVRNGEIEQSQRKRKGHQLYGLRRLAERPEAPVVLTQGTRAAVAARKLLPDMVAVTPGSRSAAEADWTPLRGRAVTIWPNNNSTGVEYVLDVSMLLRAAHVGSTKIISAPHDAEISWYAASALASGWTADRVAQLVVAAKVDHRDDSGLAPSEASLEISAPAPESAINTKVEPPLDESASDAPEKNKGGTHGQIKTSRN